MANPEEPPAGIDVSRPHSARIYDYFLDGDDNFAPDRAVGDQALAAWPALRALARENRAFIGRAVRYLAAEAGVRQFLDIGSGLPTASNVHEVAQAVDPSCRVVYCDNDPIVLAHARALLTSAPAGRCAYVSGDLREPDKILADPALRDTLDLSQPVGLILAAVVHFLGPQDEPARIIKTLVDALPSGSYVVSSHGTNEYNDQNAAEGVTRAYQQGGMQITARDSDEFARLVFDGLDLVPPGVVVLNQWRPVGHGVPPLSPAELRVNAGVARKP